MSALNNVKKKIKLSILEDKMLVSKTVIKNLKSDIFEVLKNYTNIKPSGINISIKLDENLKYEILIEASVDFIF